MTHVLSKDLEAQARRLEFEARSVSKSDPDAAQAIWTDAGRLYAQLLSKSPQNTDYVSGRLRVLRHLDPNGDLPAAVESAMAQFPEDHQVLAAAAFAVVELSRREVKRGHLERAAVLLEDTCQVLARLKRKEYVAASLVSGYRVLLDGVDQPDASMVEAHAAVEIACDALEPRLDDIIESLPCTNPKAKKNDDEDRIMPARQRAYFLLRRLFKRSERWDALAKSMQKAEDDGIENEWLVDAHALALEALNLRDEALAVVQKARISSPNHESLARREAGIHVALGNDAKAAQVLTEVALSSTTPWVWRDLAEISLRCGKSARALNELKAGLSWQDQRAPGMVWRLHFRLAELEFELGNTPASAQEVWLARDARSESGWGQSKELSHFIGRNLNQLESHLHDLDKLARGAVRKKAMQGYRQSRGSLLEAAARPACLKSMRSSFGFLKVEGCDQLVFLRKKLLGKKEAKPGDRFRVVVAPSYDRKKHRRGYQAVWLTGIDKKDHAPNSKS